LSRRNHKTSWFQLANVRLIRLDDFGNCPIHIARLYCDDRVCL